MSVPPPVAASPSRAGKLATWQRRLLGICLVVIAFELGLFLLIFPWMRAWGMNWVPMHAPHLASVWMSRYFRGAVSGLGLLNVWVALAETGRLLKSLFATREYHKN